MNATLWNVIALYWFPECKAGFGSLKTALGAPTFTSESSRKTNTDRVHSQSRVTLNLPTGVSGLWYVPLAGRFWKIGTPSGLNIQHLPCRGCGMIRWSTWAQTFGRQWSFGEVQMFEPHAKFGKLSTQGGNTCKQRKPGQRHTRKKLEILGSPPQPAAASIFGGMYV